MKKRLMAFMLVAVFTLTMLAGCGGTNKGPDKASNQTTAVQSDSGISQPQKPEHLSFTIFSLDDQPDFMTWPLVKDAMEKFNFDFKIQQVAWDNWDETTRTLVATNGLPEVLAWYNLLYGEYTNWVKQGVFKALPEDMSKYPNLQTLTQEYSIFNKLKVDGKLYAFPKVMNNNPWNEYSQNMVVYRKDWAKEAGYNFADVQDITMKDFIAYLKDIKAKDPGKLGDKLVPFDLAHGGLSWYSWVGWQYNPYLYTFKKVDGKYAWGGNDAGSLQGIMDMHSLYEEGLLAKDSYADKTMAGADRFTAGRSATIMGPIVPSILQTLFLGINTNLKLPETNFGVFCIKGEDGKFKVGQKPEWWASFAFSNNCRDEVMDRWLTVGNWMLEQEQIETAAYGVKDVDWTREGDTVKINWKPEETQEGGPKAYINDERLHFQKFFVLEGMETWLPGNPLVSKYCVEDLYHGMMNMYDTNPSYTPTDYDVVYFSSKEYDANAGPLEAETRDAVIKAVVSKDPAKEWDKFVKSKEKAVQISTDELNKAFAK